MGFSEKDILFCNTLTDTRLPCPFQSKILRILPGASVWLCMPNCEWRTAGRLPMSEIHNPYRENEVAPKNCTLRNELTPGRFMQSLGTYLHHSH